MKIEKKSFFKSRRALLRHSLMAPAAILLAGVPWIRVEAGSSQVSEDDPVAKSLKYVHDATKSERPSDDQFCYNCQYFKGTKDTEWAKCDIFPGKTVNANGWCNVWTMKKG